MVSGQDTKKVTVFVRSTRQSHDLTKSLVIVKASESIEPNKNNLALNVIAYTFSKTF